MYTSSRKGIVNGVNSAGKFHVGLLSHLSAEEWHEMSDAERAPFIADAEAENEARADSETNREAAVAVQYVLYRMPQSPIDSVTVALKRYRDGWTSVSMLCTTR